MTSKTRLIVASGIDGSGKSSHLAWIRNSLVSQNQPCKYVRLRFVAMLSLPLLLLARILGYAPRWFHPRTQTVVIEHRYDQFFPTRVFLPYLFLIDMVLASWFLVWWPLKRGRWVLCDRYVVDALIELALMLNDETLVTGRIAKWLLALIPAGSRCFILDIDPHLAYERKSDVPDIDYLNRRRTLYLQLAHVLNIPMIDGNRAFEDVQSDIIRIVNIRPTPEHGNPVA